MSEVREKARALLAYVATDGAGDVRALDTLAVLCDENDALHAALASVTAECARLRAWRERASARPSAAA